MKYRDYTFLYLIKKSLSKEFLILRNLFFKKSILSNFSVLMTHFKILRCNFVSKKYCYSRTNVRTKKKNNSITPFLPIQVLVRSLILVDSSIPNSFGQMSDKCESFEVATECKLPMGAHTASGPLRIVATPWIPFPFASLHFH